MKMSGKFESNEETAPMKSKGSNAAPMKSEGSNAAPMKSEEDNTPAADRRFGLAKIRWSIAHKMTATSVLMIILTVVAGGVGLWQVFTINQAISEAREKELQQVRSLELLAAGHRLVASLDRVLVMQDPALLSADVPVSLGALAFYMESLQETGGEPEILDLLEEMQEIYSELRQGVRKVDLLARQGLWTEAELTLEQEVRPVNEQMGVLVRRLVRWTDRDVEAMGLYVRKIVERAIILLAVLLAATVLIALGWRQVIFQVLSRSITELRHGVARISGGDLAYELDIRTGDEIEELGDEFNKMAGELADVIGELEQRVAERTRRLQTAADVAHATTSVLDLDSLLDKVVRLAREQFDLYYVGLFLVDEELDETRRTFAALRAGTGEAGREMLARGHRLEVGGESMIGQCTFRAEAHIALDVGEEAVRFDNPLLPETRSEMALPLVTRGRVVGAMSVQSAESAAFDEADIAVMQTMADQVAVAIDNARLFTRSQEALKEMEIAQGRYLGQAWADYLQTAEETWYETAQPGTPSLDETALPEIRQAAEQREVVALSGDGGARSAMAAPILLRGKVVGVLGLHDDEGARRWTDDDLAFIEDVADRMAQAAENLRLLDETQRRAAREQLVGDVTASMSETLDVEMVLQSAAQEIREKLELHDVTVRLGMEMDSDD